MPLADLLGDELARQPPALNIGKLDRKRELELPIRIAIRPLNARTPPQKARRRPTGLT
jgi:hypothetical protein